MDLMEIRRGLMMGMLNNDSLIHWGSFTADSPISSNYSFPHGFNVAPQTVIIICGYNGSSNYRYLSIKDERTQLKSGWYGAGTTHAGNQVMLNNDTSPRYFSVDATNITLLPTTTPWGNGEYLWIAIK